MKFVILAGIAGATLRAAGAHPLYFGTSCTSPSNRTLRELVKRRNVYGHLQMFGRVIVHNMVDVSARAQPAITHHIVNVLARWYGH